MNAYSLYLLYTILPSSKLVQSGIGLSSESPLSDLYNRVPLISLLICHYADMWNLFCFIVTLRLKWKYSWDDKTWVVVSFFLFFFLERKEYISNAAEVPKPIISTQSPISWTQRCADAVNPITGFERHRTGLPYLCLRRALSMCV